MDQQNILRANNRIFSIHDPIIPTIQKLLVLYIVVWSISPPLQIDLIYRIALLGCVGLWFLLNIPYNVKLERIHILALGFGLFIIISELIVAKGDLSAVLRPMGYYILIICFLMAHCYRNRWDELNWLVPICLILLTYFNIKTYQTIIVDPSVARLIVRDDPTIYHYLRQGVGGYGLLYSQVCVFPMILYWTIGSFKYSKIKLVIGTVYLVSFVLYLLNSGYTIAVVTVAVSLLVLLFYNRKSIVLAVVVTALVLALLIWLIGYNEGFRNSLISFFDGTKTAEKIKDIYLSITTTDTADSILARKVRYEISINTILSYPITGGFWNNRTGGHSAILDTFARYGIFGIYVYCKILFDFPLSLKKEVTERKEIRLANGVFISLLMINLLNSMNYYMAALIVFVFPLCYNDINKWKSCKNARKEKQ